MIQHQSGPPVEPLAKLLPWLGREAPRYTSYPSAHHFTEVGPQTHGAWLDAIDASRPVALYLHIPFCEQMCWFCGCKTSMTKRYQPVADYLDMMLREIDLVAARLARRLSVGSVHFGGGSPTILTSHDMERVFHRLHSHFDLLPEAEIAIEIDPRRLTEEKAACYARLGFNRASLGVQDFDPRVQEAIHRVQPFEVVATCCDRLRAQGIDEINIDLVYGLPFQTDEGIRDTVERVLALRPHRLAYYSYAHVPWVKKHQRLIDTNALPDEMTKAWMYLQAKTQLEAHGYVCLGIDHFAAADDALSLAWREGSLKRNFMGYTTLPSETVIAFGLSGISQFPQGLAQNSPHASDYALLVRNDTLPTRRGWCMTGEDRLRGDIIAQLMCYLEADIGRIARGHGYAASHLDAELARLAPFEEAGLLRREGRHLALQSELRMLIRPVCAVFDQYLAAQAQQYSKVV